MLASACREGKMGSTAVTHRLAGKRILIVEDEPFIAQNLASELVNKGAEVIGPVATVKAALDVIENTNLDGVTLDIKLMGEMAYPVADVLAARQIPFVFITGYDAGAVPARHANVSRIEKPFTPDVACCALEMVLAARAS
jgi:two-component SAPR family response regulator